ncbi:hypothetical protein [Bacillus cereus]|uniref:Uncharacterized protein n=1 Tax=Bacillus cereus HuA3-9 TaxID=1053205 RepID=R8CIH2_BACCE|nr:hypothetical protein [Bacillus cereus]EOO11330.1 hypothetical protein IGA_05593 [Bacillus cereus HuA3-9]
MNELLAEYKHLIDFKDKMQKSNYKFVENYLRYQKRKNRDGWEGDCIEFLKGAISIQKDLIKIIQQNKLLFK